MVPITVAHLKSMTDTLGCMCVCIAEYCSEEYCDVPSLHCLLIPLPALLMILLYRRD